MPKAQRIPSSATDVQRTILTSIERLKRPKVVSTNQVLDAVCHVSPECRLSTAELVRLIREAALCLGLIPVFDPRRAANKYGPQHARGGDVRQQSETWRSRSQHGCDR